MSALNPSDEQEKPTEKEAVKLPFDNLFLNRGFITGQNSGFHYVIVSVLTVGVYLLAPVITLLPLVFMAQQAGIGNEVLADPYALLDYNKTGFDRNYALASTLGIYLISILFFFVFLRKIQQKSFKSIFTGYDQFRMKRFWFAFFVWSVLLLITFLIEYLLDPSRYQFLQETITIYNGKGTASIVPTNPWLGFMISILLLIAFLPFQTAFEEAFFRGYLVQALSLRVGNGIIPLIVSSILFGSAHLMNPEVDAYGVPIMWSYYALFGFFMGAIALLDEGLELAWGIHLANNLVSSVLLTTESSVIKSYALFTEKSSNLHLEMLAWLCCAIITFFIFKKRYGWHNFRLLIK